MNFLSNDVMNLDQALISCNYLWITPIKTTLIVLLMYQEVELSAIFGTFIMIISIPMQGYIATFVKSLTLKAAIKTDERLRIMNEILMGVQVIKMYTWEKPFFFLVNTARA